MKRVCICLALVFSAFSSIAQFSKEVEQSYRLYNKARLLEAGGHVDSAAAYMKRSLQLNNKNALVRNYAWDVYLKAGRYSDFIEDVEDYYTKNTLPENTDDIFIYDNDYDMAVIEKAKKSKEIQQFLAGYEDLKRKNRQTVKVDKELKQIVDECFVTDQFVRTYAPTDTIKGEKAFEDRLWRYVDSTNMETIAEYIRRKGIPSSSELDGPTMQGHFIILFLHFLQTSIYSEYPVRKYLDSAILQAVYTGTFPTRYYIRFLDNRSVCRAKTVAEQRQMFGTWTDRTTDPGTKKKIRIYNPEIEDIEHVDDRRRKWLEPSLYEESLINKEIRLPQKYNPG